VRFAHVQPIWAVAGDSNHTSVGHTRHNLSENKSCVGIERNIRYLNLARRHIEAVRALSDFPRDGRDDEQVDRDE
jgi:hypothetical protein